MFETYAVPRLVIGVDALLASYPHTKARMDAWMDGCLDSCQLICAEGGYGVVVSCGAHACHIIPLVDGRADAVNAKRYVSHTAQHSTAQHSTCVGWLVWGGVG